MLAGNGARPLFLCFSVNRRPRLLVSLQLNVRLCPNLVHIKQILLKLELSKLKVLKGLCKIFCLKMCRFTYCKSWLALIINVVFAVEVWVCVRVCQPMLQAMWFQVLFSEQRIGSRTHWGYLRWQTKHVTGKCSVCIWCDTEGASTCELRNLCETK